MPRVVVVVPAYNESSTIRGVVESVRALGYPVLVCDDGSIDWTRGEAISAGAEVVRHNHNYGVGVALMQGMRTARDAMGADIIVTMDADGQHDPADIPALIAAVESGADLANGSRFLGRVDGIPLARRLLLKAVYIAFWLLSGVEVTDPCCGLKAFRPMAFQIRSHRFAWAAELCYRVSRWGRVVEVPVTVRYTTYSLGKGQRTRDAVKVGVELVRAVKGDTHVR